MIDVFFYLFSTILLGSAIGVIFANHSVHAVLLLMATFLNAAALFILLGAEFLGFMVIIVYVGAVAVLFLFVVMMLPAPLSLMKQQVKKQLPFILSIISVMGAELLLVLNEWPLLTQTMMTDAPPLTTQALGNVLYTQYFVDFQLGGLLLLVAIIGAIVLTLTPQPFSKKQQISDQINRQAADVVTVCALPSGKKS